VTNGNVAWEGDVYSQLMNNVTGEERRGRFRGLGLGPSSLASISSTQCGEFMDDDHDQCNDRVEYLESADQRLQGKLTHLEGQQAEVLAELARLRAYVDESRMSDATPSPLVGRENENVSYICLSPQFYCALCSVMATLSQSVGRPTMSLLCHAHSLLCHALSCPLCSIMPTAHSLFCHALSCPLLICSVMPSCFFPFIYVMPTVLVCSIV